jgi:hypothetical protein
MASAMSCSRPGRSEVLTLTVAVSAFTTSICTEASLQLNIKYPHRLILIVIITHHTVLIAQCSCHHKKKVCSSGRKFHTRSGFGLTAAMSIYGWPEQERVRIQ